MVVTCKNITSLPYANQLKLLAGKDALDHPITWVYYMEDPFYVDWLKGGELVITTGLVTKEDSEKLIDMIDAVATKDIAGFVINIGIYISKIPEKVISYCEEIGLPLFEMPENVRIEDVSQNICYAIFKQDTGQYNVNVTLFGILYGSYMTSKRLKRLEAAGYRQNQPYVAVVLRLVQDKKKMADGKKCLDENELYNEATLEIAYKKVEQIIHAYAGFPECLTTTDDDRMIWVCPVNGEENLTQKIDAFADALEKRIGDCVFDIGVGSTFVDLKNLMDSTKNAEVALKFSGKHKPGRPVYYDDFILLRLFEHFEDKKELEDIASKVLKDLLNQENRELLYTLDLYLNHNLVAKDAAKALFIHENTMHYRMKKIASITGRDFNNQNDLFLLQLAMEILHALDYRIIQD